MSRPATPAYERLLKLLHSKVVPEVQDKTSVVMRVLFNNTSEALRQTSVLDDMMNTPWDQKPMTAAMQDIEKLNPQAVKSNIIRLRCPMAAVGREDLSNLFPIPRDRHYSLPTAIQKGLSFNVVKARNPFTLLFLGSYYLVFPNYNQACVYYLETKQKLINGFEMELEFVAPTERHLRVMGSPLLSSKFNDSEKILTHLSENYKKISCLSLFQLSRKQLRIVSELAKINPDRSEYANQDIDPLYQILEYFMDTASRYNTVVVRNLPLGITRPAIYQLLWNYEFATDHNPLDSMEILQSNAADQLSLALLNFKNEDNARRFVRNYHGRLWDKTIKADVKPLYEPIRCEIVD